MKKINVKNINTRMGVILTRVRPSIAQRPASYFAARARLTTAN